MGYSDLKPKDADLCKGCGLWIPRSKVKDHTNPKHVGCEFKGLHVDLKTVAMEIAVNFSETPGVMKDTTYRTLPIVVSYGALRAGDPDLTTVLRVSKALKTGRCHAPFAAARLPETLKQIFTRGSSWEGFRGELEEFCRRLEDGHVVRLGSISSTHLELLTAAQDKLDKDVYVQMVKQLEGLETSDELGGDIIDFTKRKVIQLKYITSAKQMAVEERIIEAAVQLVGDLKPKNEVPITVTKPEKLGTGSVMRDTFRTEIGIIVQNPNNPCASQTGDILCQMVAKLMNKEVEAEVNKGRKENEPIVRPYVDLLLQGFVKSTFSYYVNCVRIQTPTRKFRFIGTKEDLKGWSPWELVSDKKLF